MTKTALFALSLIASALTVTPTVARAEPVIVTSIVATSDLDLTTAKGRAALDRRLVHAAREVCGSSSDVDLAGKNEDRACLKATLASARGQRQQILAAARAGEPVLVASAR